MEGVERIVEIGDGQVSDLVGWSVEFIGVCGDMGYPRSTRPRPEPAA